MRTWWEWWRGQYTSADPGCCWDIDDVEAGFYAGFALAMADVANLGARLSLDTRGPYGAAIDAWITAHSPKKGQ